MNPTNNSWTVTIYFSGKAASNLPFREYEESSSEVHIGESHNFLTVNQSYLLALQVEDFMKPYSDEPENSPTFMGAYRDQEDED